MDISKLLHELKSDKEQSLITLQRLGRGALIPLQNAFQTAEPELQISILEAIVIVADESCADFFLRTLESPIPLIRSWAAQGLLKIKDPIAIQALVRTIADHPDEGHSQFSQSSYSLIGLGSQVLPLIVPLLRDVNPFIRESAWVVLSNVIVRIPEYENNWKNLWEKLGKYDPHQDTASRNASANMWEQWVNDHVKP
jgi:HEAT repeat protein